MYMFESLHYHLGGEIDCDYIDQEHVVVNNMIKRQSKCDFSRGLWQNGLIDGAKCQSSEHKGDLFQLLCIAHRIKARLVLKTAFGLSDIQWRKFIHFLKSYLAVEEWFHDSNNKDEVNSNRREIFKVLTSLQKFFPMSEHTNGYRLPKMHGMTKMQSYIQHFGSSMNFYGGPGEAAHKTFVKSAGQKKQRRVGKFAQQTADQYYNYMLSTHAIQHLAYVSSFFLQSGTEDSVRQLDEDTDEEDDVHIKLSDKYELEVTPEMIEKMETNETIDVVWLMGKAEGKEKR
jgi:hypothetical protein